MVEFALVLPIILGFFLFVVEIGRVMMLQHTADTAAYEAARSSMVPGATTDEGTAVAQELIDEAQLSDVAILFDPPTLTDDTALVSVRVDIPMATNSWIMPQLFFGDTTVTSEVTLVCERSPIVRLSAMPELKLKKEKLAGDGI